MPLEIGDLPLESVERLTALGLVGKVLGCCEITRQGQLTLHRQHFLKASSRRIARVTRRNPIFLQEMSLSASLSRTRLTEHLNMRRKFDARIKQATKFPNWLVRLVSQISGRFKTDEDAPSDMSAMVHPRLNHKPR